MTTLKRQIERGMSDRQLENAILYISDVLSDYCETSIENDKLEQRKLDKTWNKLKDILRDIK